MHQHYKDFKTTEDLEHDIPSFRLSRSVRRLFKLSSTSVFFFSASSVADVALFKESNKSGNKMTDVISLTCTETLLIYFHSILFIKNNNKESFHQKTPSQDKHIYKSIIQNDTVHDQMSNHRQAMSNYFFKISICRNSVNLGNSSLN